MYYPFLRAKQNELLAVKELSKPILLNSKTISPIFEPVKFSPTFKNTIPHLAKEGINFTIIINPRNGSLKGKTEEILNFCEEVLGYYENYQVGIIIDRYTALDNLIPTVSRFKASKKISLIHNQKNSSHQEIASMLDEELEVVNNIINVDNLRERYFAEFSRKTIVVLTDCFQSQSKNADYLKIGESEFSEEHRLFQEEGLKGFSDYLTLGDRYSETGFSPYAVAIHITYEYKGVLRIKHFVSDDNLDNINIAGKYLEALEKLITWENTVNLNTIAMKKFRALYEKQHFPGLGVLKKLSIMNHLEVVNRVLLPLL